MAICTTLTITAPTPIITINSVGFTVNDYAPISCTVEAVGTSLGILLEVNVSRAASCKVEVKMNTPTGAMSVFVPIQSTGGTQAFKTQFPAIKYMAGSYTITGTVISEIYAM